MLNNGLLNKQMFHTRGQIKQKEKSAAQLSAGCNQQLGAA